MELSTGIQRVLDGEAVLFVGAGFSRGAVNIRDTQLKSGVEIADHFASLAGLPQTTRLEDAAELYAEDFGVDALMREVQEEFTVKEVLPYHRSVASLPWKRVYTTNYDNVFEVASRLEEQRLTPVTIGQNIYKMPKDHRICVHFNGFVDSLDRTKILDELKLTDSSYVTAAVSQSQWAMLFRQDIRLASAVFFIGYSLYDIDIKRLLAEAKDTKEKLFLYLGSSPDPVTQRKASRYGSVIWESTEEFITQVQDIATSYNPKDEKELRFLSVREVRAPFPPARITDRAFMDLFVWGQRDENLISESLRTNTTYYLQRAKIDQVFDQIERGNCILVVSSDLGNGKSMFVEGLRLGAIERGFRVFDLFDHNDGVDRELESIARSNEKVLVTIEEYQNWLDQIALFCTNAGDQATLVLTARNAVHDVLIDDLTVLVGDKPIVEINVDILNNEEITWLVDALDLYGLWGTQAGLSQRQKIKYIKEKCRGQMHAFLLKLLSSPDIGKRVSSVAERLRSKGDNYEPLLSIFILTLLNHGPTLDILVDIWGPEVISSPQFRTDPVAKEIVSFNYYAVLVRSPIVASYILKSFSDAGTVVSVLCQMAERIERGRNTSPRYNDIFKSLMRFSSLNLLLPEQGRRDALIQYYEYLKNLRGCRNHPLFWLQYAIACLVIEDISRAKTYFDTAYSLANRKGWDTFQIDNHFSRFLLVQAIVDLDFQPALANFRQACTILERQMRNERRHYPYRVAVKFQDFINRFQGEMGIAEAQEIGSIASKILERIDTLPGHRRTHRQVIKCRAAMGYVTAVCAEIAAKIEV